VTLKPIELLIILDKSLMEGRIAVTYTCYRQLSIVHLLALDFLIQSAYVIQYRVQGPMLHVSNEHQIDFAE
jgi:hypothetical protein